MNGIHVEVIETISAVIESERITSEISCLASDCIDTKAATKY